MPLARFFILKILYDGYDILFERFLKGGMGGNFLQEVSPHSSFIQYS